MSTSEKTQEGEVVCVKVRGAQEFLDLQIPKSVALQHALLYERNVHRVFVESEVNSRLFALLLAASVAVGADLGPFAKGPGAKVLYISGSGDKDADPHRMKSIFNSFDTEQKFKFIASFSMYHRELEGDDEIDLTAHFSDRGRLFQADRGRRFSAIVDAQGMRASEGLNVSQAPELSQDGNREANGLSSLAQTYPRRRAALATYRQTRWVSRLWRGDGGDHWSLPGSRSVAPLSAMR